MIVKTPAGKLVSAFGDIKEMSTLFAPDIEWSLPASVPEPRPIKGFDNVIAFQTSIWSQMYDSNCSVTILDEVGDEKSSAVRIIFHARFLMNGKPYENEYTVFVRSTPEGIREVFEGLDSAAYVDQLKGNPTGTIFKELQPVKPGDS